MTAASAPGGVVENAALDSGPTIFQALDRIGQKLESRKTDLPVIVTDQILLMNISAQPFWRYSLGQ